MTAADSRKGMREQEERGGKKSQSKSWLDLIPSNFYCPFPSLLRLLLSSKRGRKKGEGG